MEYIKDLCTQFDIVCKEQNISDTLLDWQGATYALEYIGNDGITPNTGWELAVIDSLREFVANCQLSGDLNHIQMQAFHNLFREFGIGYNPHFACMELTQHMT